MAVHFWRTLILGWLFAVGGFGLAGCDDSPPRKEAEDLGGPRLPVQDMFVPPDFEAPDAEPQPDAEPIPERRQLRIEGSSQVELWFGANIDLQVRYLGEDGLPASGPVRVALLDLQGNPLEASLGTTLQPNVREVDTEGLASFTLRAGAQPLSFKVEASADLADPVYWQVNVLRDPKGTIGVRVTYPDPKRYQVADIARVQVGMFNGTCDTVAGTPRSNLIFEADLPEISPFSGDDTTAVGNLPDGQRYAAVALGESEGGVILAVGCTDDAQIVGGETRSVRVDLVDEMMEYKGTYDVVHVIDTTSVMSNLENENWGRIARVINILDMLGSPYGERGDRIVQMACDYFELDQLACFAIQAMGGSQLVDDLIEELMPPEILEVLYVIGDVAHIFTETTLTGEILIGSSYPDEDNMLRGCESRITGVRYAWRNDCPFEDRESCTRDFSLIEDAGMPGRTIVAQFDAEVLAEDRLLFGRHTLNLEFSQLLIGLMESWIFPEMLGRPAPVTVSDLITELLPCAEIDNALGLAGACQGVISDPLSQYLYEALDGLGLGVGLFTLEGEVTVTDENPDLRADHLRDGVWAAGFGEGVQDLTPEAGTFSGCLRGECEADLVPDEGDPQP